MNRSLSPIDSRNEGHLFEKGLQFGDSAAASVMPAPLRSRDPNWLLVNDGFTLGREHEIESLFSIANGYIGSRGSLAEGCPLSAPATFVAGIFEELNVPGSVPQLMALPDWTGVRIWIDDQPLTMQQGQVLEHRRILDFRRGMLWREWRHKDPKGRITRIVTFRLASLADRHLLLHSVALTAENYSAVIRFESSMQATAAEVSFLAPEWKARKDAERANILPLALRVPGRDTRVVFSLTSQLEHSAQGTGCRTVQMHGDRIMEHCEVGIQAGAHCHLHRTLSVFTSRDGGDAFEQSVDHLRKVARRSIVASAQTHAAAWESRWNTADVEIDGDSSLQQALRFAIYHLISAANPDDPRVSIGARTLSGAGYKGHVFWDTEIYMLPFFIFTHPPSARALLEYRYHTLEAARSKAHAFGFRGAMYAWESADTGDETTPKTIIALNGEILKVPNGELEIHITADIAYAIWQYWQSTGDDDFFVSYGAEIILESARFWASRGVIEPDGSYHFRHVIGPDEYHENVDDDAYTNLMARWNLRHGARSAKLLQDRWPERWQELAARVQFTDEEICSWQKLADATFIPFDHKTFLYEQFSGYFNKESIDLKKFEPRSAAMDTILGHDRIQQTNVIKQADVVLAAFLLWDEISVEVQAANFRYYEPRTAHGSSLSPSIHALIAARMGDNSCAQVYLKQAAEIDLGNNMGNAAGGVHAASLGGLWQAMVFGFAGFRPLKDGVSFAPNLLPQWQRLSFLLQWRGREMRISIEQKTVRVRSDGEESLKLRLEDGPEVVANPGKEYAAERSESGWSAWREARL
jgi:trehalose/maltose hydrolase-like predicted phosphorylase